ncbi:MAG: permease-like cell division protein FtsX [Dysgonamonadaceae bacterium]|jgi:cell division transport system permease protein|nr:permease-like cell division protein FtsX [Dysgonamonadaceae bacterium]
MKRRHKIKQAKFLNSKITATISISLVLFLLGLIILLSLSANKLSERLKESISFNIILQDNADKIQINRLKQFLNTASFVKNTEYVSKEEAIKLLEEDLGENIEEFIGFNPLPALIKVQLKANYMDVDSLAIVENKIMGFSTNIKEIEYRKDLMQTVNANLQQIEFIIFGLALLLAIISFALINNTIRLMVYSKRFLIHTMKLVGAKANFIRKPFIVSNLICGIIAAFIAAGLLMWLLYYLQQILDYPELIDWQNVAIAFGGILCLGILIAVSATYMAVNKYIKMNSNNLYYI